MTPRQVWASDTKLLTPLPDATILSRNQETHLVLRQSLMGKINRVQRENSNIVIEPTVIEDNGEYKYLHFRLPLERGLNKFIIIPDGQFLELKYQPLQGLLPTNLKSFYFFHQNGKLPENCTNCHDLQETKTMELVGLKQNTSCSVCHKNILAKHQYEHSPVVNQQCLSCHQQYVKPWRVGFREGKIDATCFACHTNQKAWESNKYRHGPMMGGCTLCHNPHGDDYDNLLWAEGSVEICVTCHVEKQDLLEENDYKTHGIIFGKGCTICHEPHASDEEYMLLKPINELCVSCHNRLAGLTKGHPVAGHPVKGPRERRRDGRELTCVGCHDPHGTPNQFMLIKSKRGGILCRECHKK